jgi:hypothetical protein
MPGFHRLRRLAGVNESCRGSTARTCTSLGATFALALAALVAAPGNSAKGGFLEELFSFGRPPAFMPQGSGDGWEWRHLRRGGRRAGRHLHLPLARSALPAQRRDGGGEAVSSPADETARSVCVRSCDGTFFPAPNPSSERGAARQPSCASVCPDTETKLFTIPPGSDNIADAKAVDGESYARFVARLSTRGDKAKSCSCHAAADDAARTRAALNDPTLQPGDAVVTSEGVKVFKGGAAPHRKNAFLSLAQTPNLAPSQRGALAAIDRAIRTPFGRALSPKPERRLSHRERHAEKGHDPARQ